MDVQEIPGIGPATAQKLRNAKISSVEALIALDVGATVDGLSARQLTNLINKARTVAREPAEAPVTAAPVVETPIKPPVTARRATAEELAAAVRVAPVERVVVTDDEPLPPPPQTEGFRVSAKTVEMPGTNANPQVASNADSQGFFSRVVGRFFGR